MRFLLVLFVTLSLHADVLLVANRGGSTISMIDPETMQFLGTAPVGTDPHEIAVSPDGRTAYVTNYQNGNGHSLSVVDIATRTKLRDIDITPLQAPHGIVENNGKIWFTAEDSMAVGRYDPATDRIDWVGRSNEIGTHMLAVKKDGSTVYTANIVSGTASIIPVTGEESASRKDILAVFQSEGIALSPDERELWLGSAGDGGIAVIDLATESVVATLSPGTFAYRLTFTHDGRFVLVPRAPNGVIAVYDAAARTLLRTIPIGGAPLSVIVAPNDRTLFVATVNPSRVWKVDLVTGTILGGVAVSNTPDGLALAREPRQGAAKRRSVRS